MWCTDRLIFFLGRIVMTMSFEIIAWVPMILFFLAPFAQVYRNWKNKSAKGVSQATIVLCITGLMCSILYDHFMALPLAYEVMHPLILFAWGLLAFQEYWFSGRVTVRRSIIAMYVGIVLAAVGLFFWGQYYPLQVGAVMGWAFALLYTIFQVPQIIKNYRESSVEGLSFSYISIMGLASLTELSIAYIRLLPLQSVANATRGIMVFLVFVYQFSKYGHRKRHKVS